MSKVPNCMSSIIREQRDSKTDNVGLEVEELLFSVDCNTLKRHECKTIYEKIIWMRAHASDDIVKSLEIYAQRICRNYRQKFMYGLAENKGGLLIENTLNVYVTNWISYTCMGKFMNSFFTSLDKHIVRKSSIEECDPSVKSIHSTFYSLILKKWSEFVIDIKNLLIEALLGNIERERAGEVAIGDDVMKTFSDSILAAGSFKNPKSVELYRVAIEQPLLEKLECYYISESKKHFELMPVEEAIAKCSKIIKHEDEILSKMLPMSADLIVKRAWDIFIGVNIDRILERARYYVEHEENDCLRNSLTFLKSSPIGMGMINITVQQREELIFTKLQETHKTTKFYDYYVNVYRQEHELLKYTFDSNPATLAALEKGVRAVIKKNLNQEHLAEYCDHFVRNELIGMDETEVKIWMAAIINIVTCMEDRNTFNQLYSKHLASRLGNMTSKTEEVEKMFLSKMEIPWQSVENSYLQFVKSFYGEKFLELVHNLDVKDYVAECLQLLNKEMETAKTYTPAIYDKVLKEIRILVVFDHRINTHYKTIIYDQDKEALSNAYQLLNISSATMFHMLEEYRDYIEKRTEDLFENFRDDMEQLTDSLVQLNKQQYAFIKSFSSHPSFIKSLNEGMMKAINRFPESTKHSHQNATRKFHSFSELLVRSCDQLMKSGGRSLSEKELDEKLTGIVTISEYIEDKDVFKKMYSNALAMRLINEASTFMEAEEMMISKLRQCYGSQFVRFLEKMVTDVQLSKEITKKFNKDVALSLSFNICVIQTGSWPIQSCKISPTLPRELSRGMTLFNEFYSKCHSGRKLHWHHSLSTCDVKLNHLRKTCTIQTSVVVTSILNTFNDVDPATFDEIQSSTDIEAKDLLKYLQFLSTQQILSNGDGNNVTKESVFSLNFTYKCKKAKFRLMPLFKEGVQEAKETTRVVLEDRKFYLQALIVKIMKSKKTMTHSDLANEVIQESISNFIPSQEYIQRIINGLIEKEYLAMAKGRSDVYNYLA